MLVHVVVHPIGFDWFYDRDKAAQDCRNRRLGHGADRAEWFSVEVPDGLEGKHGAIDKWLHDSDVAGRNPLYRLSNDDLIKIIRKISISNRQREDLVRTMAQEMLHKGR